jgi:methionyl-tRNA synthetase
MQMPLPQGIVAGSQSSTDQPSTMSAHRRILVTSALPNANGDIHLGHLLEHVQTDIWVRFQRLRGHVCTYVCADDTHGTATMLKAEQEGVPPEQLIERIRAQHAQDFAGFLISHDNYYSTHSDENRRHVEGIYAALQAGGFIFTRAVEQLYDPSRDLFLADRFVKGTCPNCNAPDQYGDNCEQCGATYDAIALRNPRSQISGAEPVLRTSEHYFFDLPRFTEMLAAWTRSGAIQPEVANKLAEWLGAGLKPWDISRDAPYFGFLIPGTTDKYFYVWLDAPIGYMASFDNFCQRRGELTFDDYWRPGAGTEVHHFIGKDIINFHALFWPAVLEGSGHRKPTRIHVHGFVTVDGTKMSKSRGTFINAGTYLRHLDPEYLRYYFATKLNGTVDDVDINLSDFVQRVNSDLVGKIVNIASRSAGFIHRYAGGRLGSRVHDDALWQTFVAAQEPIASHFESGDFGRAVREISALADRANQYIAHHAPWTLAKDEARLGEVQDICTQGLNLFRILVGLLKPILPRTAERSEEFLNVPPLYWSHLAEFLCDHRINAFEPLLQRIESAQVDRMIEAAKEPDARILPPAPAAARSVSGGNSEDLIDIDDFNRVKLRVARIVAADAVEGADRLLRLTVDLGGEERQVFAGIKAAYDPEALIGRLTVVVANLRPRRMRFGESQGMVLAAGPGGDQIFLLAPDAGAQPGMDVK